MWRVGILVRIFCEMLYDWVQIMVYSIFYVQNNTVIFVQIRAIELYKLYCFYNIEEPEVLCFNKNITTLTK